jgi:hypothetical protein
MSDFRDMNDQVKINDADGDVRRADRTDAGMNTGSASADATGENRSVLDDVAHPFDQTNGILDSYDETHPGNVTGESASEYAASAGATGRDAAAGDAGDSYIDGGDTPVVPPPLPPAGR